MKKDALRGFVFYTQDYFGDMQVRLMPYDIRIVWTEAFLLMDQSPRRGVLLQKNGEPYSLLELAAVINCPVEVVERGLKYAIDHEICGVDRTTRAITSRKMIREQRRREAGSKFGKKGGGNPNLRENGANPKSTENQSKTPRKRAEDRIESHPATLTNDNGNQATFKGQTKGVQYTTEPEPEPDPKQSPLKDLSYQQHSPPLRQRRVSAADDPEIPKTEYMGQVLELYRALPCTPDRITIGDTKIAAEMEKRNLALEAVECGLIQIALRQIAKQQKVNSLVYFVGAIEDVAAKPIPPDYLAYHRQKLAQAVSGNELQVEP